jgi:hypothetical protein
MDASGHRVDIASVTVEERVFASPSAQHALKSALERTDSEMTRTNRLLLASLDAANGGFFGAHGRAAAMLHSTFPDAEYEVAKMTLPLPLPDAAAKPPAAGERALVVVRCGHMALQVVQWPQVMHSYSSTYPSQPYLSLLTPTTTSYLLLSFHPFPVVPVPGADRHIGSNVRENATGQSSGGTDR